MDQIVYVSILKMLPAQKRSGKQQLPLTPHEQPSFFSFYHFEPLLCPSDGKFLLAQLGLRLANSICSLELKFHKRPDKTAYQMECLCRYTLFSFLSQMLQRNIGNIFYQLKKLRDRIKINCLQTKNNGEQMFGAVSLVAIYNTHVPYQKAWLSLH